MLVTPRLHGVHRVPATTSRNLGTILSIWDRIAGTLVVVDTARQEPIGVPGELDR